MRKMMIALALGLLSVSASTNAEFKDYGKSGPWDIWEDEHDCTMAADFDNNSNLAMDYDARSRQITLRFSVPQTKSLKTKDTREIDIVFTNGTSGSIDTGWGTKTFIAVVGETDPFFTRQLNEQFLDDLAKYKTVAFFYKDVILSAYDLADSAKAVDLLRRCARARARVNPSDPFQFDKA